MGSSLCVYHTRLRFLKSYARIAVWVCIEAACMAASGSQLLRLTLGMRLEPSVPKCCRVVYAKRVFVLVPSSTHRHQPPHIASRATSAMPVQVGIRRRAAHSTATHNLTPCYASSRTTRDSILVPGCMLVSRGRLVSRSATVPVAMPSPMVVVMVVAVVVVVVAVATGVLVQHTRLQRRHMRHVCPRTHVLLLLLLLLLLLSLYLRHMLL